VEDQDALPPDGPPDGGRPSDNPSDKLNDSLNDNLNDGPDDGAPDPLPRGPAEFASGPPSVLRGLWPAALLLAIAAATLLLTAATPSRPEAPAPAPEEGDASVGKGPDEKPEDAIFDNVPEGPVGTALRVVDSVLMGAGLLCVLLLFRRRARRWLLPPPREAPLSTWGGEQLLHGILLAFAMLVLVSAIAGLVPAHLPVGGALVQAAGQLAIAATVVVLVVTRPTILPRVPHVPPTGPARKAVASLGISGRDAGANALRGAVALVAAFPLVAGAAFLGGLIHVALTGAEPAPHPVIERLAEADAVEVAVLVGVACVVAPLCEEIFFRGFLYPSIRDRFGVAGGVVASSLVFAMVHPGLPNQMATFVLGVAFCLVYERAGTLVAPVVAHAIFNAIQLAFALALRAAG